MKQLLKIFSAILMIVLISCEEESPCPSNMNLGEIRIEDSTRNLFYGLTDTLVFRKVIDGTELRFLPQVNTNLNNGRFQNTIIHPCLETSFNINVSYTGEFVTQQFQSEDGSAMIDLRANVNNVMNDEKLLGSPFQDILFYDYFLTYIYINFEGSCFSNFMTSDKGNNLDFDWFYYGLEPQNITLDGESYENVYFTSNGNMEYYFSPEKRIIGYRDERANLWMFDRVE